MLKHESNDIGKGENNNRGARACDTCQSTVCTVYCHADFAYLCTSCDAQVHSANRVASRHKRVRVCESCERAPAAFLCEADDAFLCTACDSEVHSANPLARRHRRVPILPVSGNSYGPMATHHKTMTDPEKRVLVGVQDEEGEEDAKETASWLFPNSDKNSGNHNTNNQNNELLFNDDYLDLAGYNSSMDYQFTSRYNQHQRDCSVQTNYGGDRVVPLQLEERGNLRDKQHNITSGFSGSHYNYNGSINHNEFKSSMETDFVPEPTARETTSNQRPPKGTIEQLPDPPIQMLCPMDRKARVLRYREKRKTRKFEKTIRYASRKAYAERRPRINGRFAKRRETEAERDFNRMPMYYDTGYGIVPSF